MDVCFPGLVIMHKPAFNRKPTKTAIIPSWPDCSRDTKGERGRLTLEGMAFLPRLAVARDIRSKKLVAIEVMDAEPLGRSLDVIHSRHRPQSAEALTFLRTLQATVNEVPGARARPHPRRR